MCSTDPGLAHQQSRRTLWSNNGPRRRLLSTTPLLRLFHRNVIRLPLGASYSQIGTPLPSTLLSHFSIPWTHRSPLPGSSQTHPPRRQSLPRRPHHPILLPLPLLPTLLVRRTS